MAVTRYNNRNIIFNSDESYLLSDMYKKRGIKAPFPQFTTPDLSIEKGGFSDIQTISVTWTIGSKYYNLAKQYYGDEEYWWVIAWFNLAPLETDLKPGDTILVPMPLENILSTYGVI